MRRPSGLSHNRGLATGSLRYHLGPIKHERAGFIRRRLSVEESVAVDGAEVGGRAEFGIVLHGNHSVDCDDRAIVAGTFEDAAGLADGASDLPN